MTSAGTLRVALAALFALALALGCTTAKAAQPRHLIYIHGRIVQEEQSTHPTHPKYGTYELDAILEAFRARGFVVHADLRPKDATVSESADRVVAQIRRILASGVSADHVTVVGASMGASIALLASVRLQEPELRSCVLGACLAENVRSLVAEEGRAPCGRVLSIREENDEASGPCTTWTDALAAGHRLVAREQVLHTGLGHGFLYRPLPEWVEPVAQWATAP